MGKGKCTYTYQTGVINGVRHKKLFRIANRRLGVTNFFFFFFYRYIDFVRLTEKIMGTQLSSLAPIKDALPLQNMREKRARTRAVSTV